MFIRTAVARPTEMNHAAILLPALTVPLLGADDVAVVQKAPRALEIRKLKLGRQTSGVVEVVEAPGKGETVVVEGALLLRGEAAKQ